MIKENVEQLFIRDLKKLQQEISSYQNEMMMWQVAEGIHNSAGNLCCI